MSDVVGPGGIGMSLLCKINWHPPSFNYPQLSYSAV